ncbi:MAG: type II toxin-antitoxin system HicB family antitoxin [Pyrinomonadaceae bacterium]
MRTLEFTFWQDGEFFIGHLNEYPDYETQGYSKEELIENLKNLLVDLEANQIPFIRRVEELVLA